MKRVLFGVLLCVLLSGCARQSAPVMVSVPPTPKPTSKPIPQRTPTDAEREAVLYRGPIYTPRTTRLKRSRQPIDTTVRELPPPLPEPSQPTISDHANRLMTIATSLRYFAGAIRNATSKSDLYGIRSDLSEMQSGAATMLTSRNAKISMRENMAVQTAISYLDSAAKLRSNNSSMTDTFCESQIQSALRIVDRLENSARAEPLQ